jgi:hypothetical protein
MTLERKWQSHDTRKFLIVRIIQILPTKFAFKDHFIVNILTRQGEVSDTRGNV